MKISVTTASGSLGSAVIKQLISDIGKENVIGIARTPEKARHLGIEIRKGDYNSREDFNNALKGIEAVLVVSGMDKPENRIIQHRNIIEAAKANKVRKIVYTSIIGGKKETTFSPIINSNRQTEKDISESGLDYVIGRNGLYIEPDLAYIENYVREGAIINCAGDGKTAYTNRDELAFAYSKMLREDKHNGQIFNLVGEGITQDQLADLINRVYQTKLTYRSIPVEDYLKERKEALGEFLGTIIAGIYSGIRNGDFDLPSDFQKAAGRAHKSALEMIKAYKESDG
jgi:NAD(P)H dehydrogenase (quinone)